MKINSLPFQKVIIDSTKKFVKIKTKDYLELGYYRIIDQSQSYVYGYTNDKKNVNFSDFPAIVFGDHTRVFKYIDFPFAIGADGVKVLLVDSEIADLKYIYFYLKSIQLPNAGYSRHFKFLKTSKILLPEDKDDQIRIANLLSQVELLISKRKESIQLLDELLESTFLHMFGDPVLNTKNFTIEPLFRVCREILGGGTPSKSNVEFYTGDIPWVTPKDMKQKYVKTSIDKITEQAIKQSAVKLVPKGSLLMVVRSGILKKKLPLAINIQDVTINQDLKAFVVNEDKINVEYFYYFLNQYQKYLLKKVRSVTADNLKFNDIKKISVMKPPKTLQDKFATIVQQVEKTKVIYQSSLDELHELFGSLSQRAFKGELDLSRMELDLDSTETVGESASSKTSSQKEIKVSIEPKKVGDITEKQILKLLENDETLSIDGLVKKWKENKGLKTIYTASDFELIKEKIFNMIKEKKVIQSFEFTEMLLKVKK